MTTGRPGAHIATMLFLGAMIVGGISTTDFRNPQFLEQWVLLSPYSLAAIALMFPNRWSHLYCSLTLLILPAFLAFQIAVLLFATPAPILEIVPWIAVDALLYWLFHAYALGKSSKEFYARQEPVQIMDPFKSLLSRKTSRGQPGKSQHA